MKGRYKSYPEYKNSGIEWLREIPTHWTVSKIKFIAPYQVGWTPPTKNDENFEGENLWANISDLRERIIYDTAKKISDTAAEAASMEITPTGSLMYSFKLSVGAVSFAGKDMYTNEAIASFLDEAELPLTYLYYALPKFIIENASTNIYGAKILNQELISNAMMFAPPYQEAEKIADFLDYQTIKIDTLIEKQQQLIQLLQEKRQAVISHSVTKGLNPAAKMRESGIEWLGEVPEHWSVTRLKYVCSHIIDCPHSTPEYDSNGEYPAIRTADINIGFLDLTNCRRVTKEIYNARNFRLIPKHNDIIYSREGARFGLGALVPEGADVCLAQRVMLFRVKKTPEYVMWALNSQSTYKQAQQDVMGSASPHINVNTIENFSLAWPPEAEREKIASHIRITTELMDKIISISSSKINFLQERRAALISAAVTGKIDVRNSIESKVTQTDKEVAA